MGKAVHMFCCGDLDPKRVPQGTECLEPLLDDAPSHLPSRPQRCFTGENTVPITPLVTNADQPFSNNVNSSKKLFQQKAFGSKLSEISIVF